MINLLYLLTIIITTTIGGLFVGDISLIFIFSFFYIFLVYLNKRFFNDLDLKLIFTFYSIIGVIITVFHQSRSNKYGFGPNFDDSFYVGQSLDFLYNRNIYSYDTIYEIIISPLVFFGEDVLNILPINILMACINLGLIYKISKKINPQFKAFYLGFLVLNYFFIEAGVFIYRDHFAIFFLLLSILFFYENKNIKGFCFFAATVLIRPTTAVIALMFFVLKNIKFLNGKNRWIGIAMLTCIVVGIYNYVPLGFLTRSGFSGEVSGFSLAEISQYRVGGVTDAETDITSKFLAMGMIGAPIVFLINIFSPMRFRELFVDRDFTFWINHTYVSTYSMDVVNYQSILSFFSIIGVCFFFIPFFGGLYNFFKKNKKNTYILMVFFISIFLVSYVSFQPRHKLHFLIFVPLICSYCNFKLKNIVVIGAIFSSISILIGMKGWI